MAKKKIIFLLVLIFSLQSISFSSAENILSEAQNKISSMDLGGGYTLLSSHLSDHSLSSHERAIALRMLLEIDTFLNDTTSILEHTTLLSQIAEEKEDSFLNMLSFYYYSVVYYNLYDDTMAMKNLDSMRSIAISSNSSLGMGLYHYLYGQIYYSYEQYFEAADQFSIAFSFFSEEELDSYWNIPNFKNKSRLFLKLSNILSQKDEEILKKELEKLSQEEERETPLELILDSWEIGVQLSSHGLYELASREFLRASEELHLVEFGTLRNTLQSGLDRDLGIAYYYLGEYELSAELLIYANDWRSAEEEASSSETFNENLRQLESQKLQRENEQKTFILRIVILFSFLLSVAVIFILFENRRTRRLTREIYYRSITDALTGLYNRVTIMDKIEHISSQNAVALIDIDDFKKINDEFGHLTGDEVLKKIASILQEKTKENGFAARYGGEEFLVVLTNTKDVDSLCFFEDIRKTVEELSWSFEKSNITLSIGVICNVTGSFDEVFKHADDLLYMAKTGGKNRVCHMDCTSC